MTDPYVAGAMVDALKVMKRIHDQEIEGAAREHEWRTGPGPHVVYTRVNKGTPID